MDDVKIKTGFGGMRELLYTPLYETSSATRFSHADFLLHYRVFDAGRVHGLSEGIATDVYSGRQVERG